jgi:hypothetical protein
VGGGAGISGQAYYLERKEQRSVKARHAKHFKTLIGLAVCRGLLRHETAWANVLDLLLIDSVRRSSQDERRTRHSMMSETSVTPSFRRMYDKLS